MPKDWGGPYVQAAVFCRQRSGLGERSGGYDIAGIFDGMEAPGGHARTMAYLLIVVVPGEQHGNRAARMRLDIRNPDATLTEIYNDYVGDFGEPHAASKFEIPLTLELVGAGLYHVMVWMNGHLLSKIPMTVVDSESPGPDPATGFLTNWPSNGFQAD